MDSTDKAWRVYPPEQGPGAGFWVPRSVCTHRSQLETDAAHLHPLHHLTLEDWWVGEHPELYQSFP